MIENKDFFAIILCIDKLQPDAIKYVPVEMTCSLDKNYPTQSTEDIVAILYAVSPELVNDGIEPLDVVSLIDSKGQMIWDEGNAK